MTSRKIQQLRAAVLATLMIGSVLAGSVAFAGAAAAADTADADAGGDAAYSVQENDGNPTFGPNSSMREIRRGDTLLRVEETPRFQEENTERYNNHRPFVVNFNGESTVTVVISPGDNTGDYYGDVTIEDTDGDGQAKVYFNTFEAGHTNPFEIDSGEITRWNQTEFDDPDQLMTSTRSNTGVDAYSVLLVPGNNPEDGFVAQANLKLEEAETTQFNTHVAPAGTMPEKPSQIWKTVSGTADAHSNMTEEVQAFQRDTETWDPRYREATWKGYQFPTQVAAGDSIILAPWGDGLYGPMEHAKDVTDGSDAEAFNWLLENGHMNFEVYQIDNALDGPGGGGNMMLGEPYSRTLDLSKAVEEGHAEVINAPGYTHMAFAIDTSGDSFWVDDAEEHQAPQAGDKYVALFEKTGRTDSEVERDWIVTGVEVENYSPRFYDYFELAEPNVTVDPLSDSGWEESEVSGLTNLAPGTELDVTVNAAGVTTETTATVTRERVKVSADDHYGRYTWNVTADLSEVTDSNQIGVKVSADNFEEQEVPELEPDVQLSPEQKVTQLEDQVASLEEDLNSVREQRNDLQLQLDEAQSALNQTEEEQDNLESEIESLEEERDQLQTERDDLQSQLDDIEAELEDVEGVDSGSELVEQYNTLQSDYEEVNQTLQEADQTIEDLQSQLNESQAAGTDSDDTESTDESGPGFGFAVALVALLAIAGIATRNRA